MSSGPEHYKRAEECLEMAGHPDTMPGSERDFLMRAQTHATLALAAATVEGTSLSFDESVTLDEAWREAMS